MVSQDLPFLWYFVSEPVKKDVKIRGVPHPVALRAYLVNQGTPGVKYLKLPFLYQDCVIRLDDLIDRVDDPSCLESLAPDFQDPWRIQCPFWTMDGEVISEANIEYWSRLGRARQKAVHSGEFHRDKAYREQWVLCFKFALRIAAEIKYPLGGPHLLNRFYRPAVPSPKFQQPGPPHIFQLYLVKHERLFALTSDQLHFAASEAMKNAGSVSATWITKNEADKKGYVKLSTNPLGLYSTWIKRDDLVRFEKDQTGSEMWTRVLPTATQVVNYNTRLLSKGKFKFNRMTSVSKSSLLQWPGQNLYFYSRRSTEGIMGASANKWATNTLGWRSPKYQARAEWLHLIAHQFDHSGDRFSNMIFGTKECNTDMMRAEATVRQLLFSGRTYAVEVTIEVKRDMPRVTMPNHSNSIDRVTWLYPQKGEPEVPRFPHWLACKLEYTITSYRPDPQLVYVNDPHTTTFYPFSRQRPFLFEYQLDYMLLEMYLGTFEIPIETDPNQVFKDILAKNKPAKPNFFEWNVNYDLNDDDGEWAAVGVDDLTRSEADEEYRELDEQELDEEF